jgi:hypothetical protein
MLFKQKQANGTFTFFESDLNFDVDVATRATKDEEIKYNLDKAKAQKINEIGNAKEEALYAPIAYLNTSFSASERACQNMLGNLVLNGETVEWQDLNKKPIIMTRAQFQTLAVMVKNQRNASYFKESELMKKIGLAKTPEELNLIKW